MKTFLLISYIIILCVYVTSLLTSLTGTYKDEIIKRLAERLSKIVIIISFMLIYFAYSN